MSLQRIDLSRMKNQTDLYLYKNRLYIGSETTHIHLLQIPNYLINDTEINRSQVATQSQRTHNVSLLGFSFAAGIHTQRTKKNPDYAEKLLLLCCPEGFIPSSEVLTPLIHIIAFKGMFDNKHPDSYKGNDHQGGPHPRLGERECW